MKRRLPVLAIGLCAALLGAAVVHAGGIEFGALFYTIDLSETFALVPVAAGDAFDALDIALADLGFSPAERDEIRASFDEGLAAVEGTLGNVPTTLPVPLLGGTLEISLPLLVIDGIRVSFGLLSDEIFRGIADLAGVPVPAPLFSTEVDEPEFQASFQGDVEFATWMAATEVSKRFDAFLAALDLALGVHLVRGEILPQIEYEVPSEIADGVGEALAALHLDGLTWSAFGLHASIGLEIGPPFLRVGGSVRFVLPITQASGFWGVRVAGIGGNLGVRIRF